MSAHWLTLNDTVDPKWWRPLEALSARAAAFPGLPPIDPDDFVYAARICREGLPVLHVYRHVLTHRYLNVDEMGLVWRYVGSSKEILGGYALVPDLADGLERAELGRAQLLAARTRRGPRGMSERCDAVPAFGPDAPIAEAGPGDGGSGTDKTDLDALHNLENGAGMVVDGDPEEVDLEDVDPEAVDLDDDGDLDDVDVAGEMIRISDALDQGTVGRLRPVGA